MDDASHSVVCRRRRRRGAVYIGKATVPRDRSCTLLGWLNRLLRFELHGEDAGTAGGECVSDSRQIGNLREVRSHAVAMHVAVCHVFLFLSVLFGEMLSRAVLS